MGTYCNEPEETGMGAVLIDVFRLSQDRQCASGVLEVSELPRLAAAPGAFLSGHLAWRAQGTEGRRGLAGAVLRVKGELHGTCCRCGAPITLPVHLETSFLFAKSEAEADAIPLSEDGDDEIAVGSTRFDAAAWVEEEVLLALPLFPAHDDCEPPSGPGQEDEPGKGGSRSPFAVLAGLKVKH